MTRALPVAEAPSGRGTPLTITNNGFGIPVVKSPDGLGLPVNATQLLEDGTVYTGVLGGRAFTPLQLLGESDAGGFWSAYYGVDGAVGEGIAGWTDMANSVELTVPDGEGAPVLQASGPRRWIEYAGAEALTAEFAVSTAGLTAIMAVRFTEADADNNKRCLVLKIPAADAAERDINFNCNADSALGNFGQRHPQDESIQFAGGAATLASDGVISYQRDGTAIQDAWVNGVAGTRNTATTTTFTTTHIAVGVSLGTSATTFPAGDYWVGRIYGLFVIDRVLSAAERLQVETYMQKLMF